MSHTQIVLSVTRPCWSHAPSWAWENKLLLLWFSEEAKLCHDYIHPFLRLKNFFLKYVFFRVFLLIIKVTSMLKNILKMQIYINKSISSHKYHYGIFVPSFLKTRAKFFYALHSWDYLIYIILWLSFFILKSKHSPIILKFNINKMSMATQFTIIGVCCN